MNPLIFKTERAVLDIYNYDSPDNIDKKVRVGDAILFLDSKTKARLRIDAQFRPNLHNIAVPSASWAEETTDTEMVLKILEKSRQLDLLPTEKIRKGMESELQCCHVEHKQYGYGNRRRFVTIPCQKRAAAGNL